MLTIKCVNLCLTFVSGKMNIVEGENGKVLFATDGYTPPPLNDNDEDAIRRKDQMEVNCW